MKTRVVIIVLIVVVAILILLSKVFKKEPPVTFETAGVARADISVSVTATGTIEALKTVNVGTQVSGIIQDVYVDFNDVVKQGQLLARLDEVPLRAAVEQSKASLDQAQAQLNYHESNYNRMKVLYDKNLIAQTDYDQAIYNYENSKASVVNAKSALSKARVNLEYATITSPISGVVLNRAIEEGQTVAASFTTPTLFTIVNDLTQMEVQASVDEADIGLVQQGQRVEFTVDAYPDLKFNGSVSQVRLQPVTTNNVVKYVVILSAPNPDKKLMPGMTASATIIVEEKTNTLVLPGEAIRFTPDEIYLKETAGKAKSKINHPSDTVTTGSNSTVSTVQENHTATVWMKDQNNELIKKTVQTGLDNGTDIEILAGLQEGDEVVISMNYGKAKPARLSTNPGPVGF